MTLIVTSISANCIVQVSDRKLTWTDGIQRTNSANKVVVFGPAVFGYTGLAYVGKLRTDRWLAEELSKLPNMHVQAAAQAICEKATDAFDKMRGVRREHKRHAFVCAAWVAVQGIGLRPTIYIITNALDRVFRWRDKPTDAFQVLARAFADNEMPTVIPIGDWERDWEKAPSAKRLRRQANRAAQRDCPHAVRDSLAAFIRDQAERRQTVGKDLLAVIFPKGYLAPSALSRPGPMVPGLGTSEVSQLPSTGPSRSYPDSALHVIGEHVIDLSQELRP
jgi:hypothetical protein